jgi:sulfide:quinone oxidoreductase
MAVMTEPGTLRGKMSAASTTVIAGAGFGGIAAARTLRTLLPPPHRIMVVDWRPEVSVGAGYTSVLTGRRRPEQVSRRLSGITRHGLEFRCSELVGVDPEKRVLDIAGDRVRADALVLAPGARLTLEPLPGAAGVAHQFYELDAALRLGGALDAFNGGRVVMTVIAPPYKCPAAPHEAALLIHERLARKPGPDRFSLSFFTSEPQPMPIAGATVSAAVRDLYEQRGIVARFGAKAVRVHSPSATPAGSPPSRAVAGELELADGTREPFDLLIAIPAHVAPAFLREAGLLGGNGWVTVARDTLATSFDSVWAIGDVAHVPLAGGGMLPKAGVFARAQGEAVAHAVAARLLGRGAPSDGPPVRFDGKGGCYLETGRGEAALVEGDFFAEPAPVVTLQPPSRAGLAGKEKFIKDWARWY